MKTRIILSALLLTACLTSLAWADGRISGNISYKDCNCHVDDLVCIRPVSGGACQYFPVVCSPGPGYTTYPNTIPPGTYYIYVVPHEGSDCTGGSPIQGFVHGSSNDQFNITICGPEGGGSRPEPGP
jgi:hypothetical protein